MKGLIKKALPLAKHIFGAEPSDAEIHEFVLKHYQKLNFGESKELCGLITSFAQRLYQRRDREKQKRTKAFN